jgi:regulator of nucleoside diphosphate kinase
MSDHRILVTEVEMRQLKRLLDSARKFLRHRDLQHLIRLDEELDEAEIISQGEMPSEIITMNSQVRVKDLDAGKEVDYTLVFPRDADVANNKISVLAPIGVALLGGHAGEVIEAPVPAGVRRLEVQKVLHPSGIPGDQESRHAA